MRRHKPPSLLSRARPCGPPRGAQLGAACRHACCLHSCRRPSSVVEFGFEKKVAGREGQELREAHPKHASRLHSKTQGVRPSVRQSLEKNTYLVHNVSLFGFGARARVSMSVRGGLAHSAIGRGSFSCPPAPPLGGALVALLVCVPWWGGWPCRNPLLRGGRNSHYPKTKKEEKRDAGGMQAARGRDSRRAPEQEKILRVYATGDGSVLQGSQPVGMFTT